MSCHTRSMLRQSFAFNRKNTSPWWIRDESSGAMAWFHQMDFEFEAVCILFKIPHQSWTKAHFTRKHIHNLYTFGSNVCTCVLFLREGTSLHQYRPLTLALVLFFDVTCWGVFSRHFWLKRGHLEKEFQSHYDQVEIQTQLVLWFSYVCPRLSSWDTWKFIYPNQLVPRPATSLQCQTKFTSYG